MGLLSWGQNLGKNTAKNRLEKYQEKMAPERAIEQSKQDITTQIENLPEYQISQEAKDRLSLLQESATNLEQQASEQTDVAKSRAGMYMAPGTGAASQDIEKATASQVGALQQMGGSNFLSNITKVGQSEQQAYDELIKNNITYQEQSDQALMNALSTEAGMKMQAAGLKAQGLEGMIQERDKSFQSQLSKAQTGLQYDIAKLSLDQQQRTAQENKKFLGIF